MDRFSPTGRRAKFELFGHSKPASALSVGIQVTCILMVVRFAMIISGLTFVDIPLIDPLLMKLAEIILDK
jgi:hypothetical protein